MKPKLVFMPGCFDGFEGTQEELDEMIAMIKSKVDDGTLFEDSRPVDPDSEEGQELIQKLIDNDPENRSVQ
jgi:hypothetical protein